jgi:L-aspartate oxidase
MPRPLLSEALRGHGALLRDSRGERFVDELLPRDVVSRAITAVLLDQRVDHVWLDATGLDHFAERFPTIAADLTSVGLDPAVDLLPVAPAAHHQCGGVITDLDGATTVPGLWACGETSCTGVHGANRLASNSLLEGMVFGARVVEAIAAGVDEAGATGAMRAALGKPSDGMVIGGRPISVPWTAGPPSPSGSRIGPADVPDERRRLQRVMTTHAGVLRSAESLGEAVDVLVGIRDRLDPAAAGDPAHCELANLAEVGLTLLAGALERRESRGAHARSDFPTTDDELRCRLVVGSGPGSPDRPRAPAEPHVR